MVLGFEGGESGIGVGVGRGVRVGCGVSPEAGLPGASDSCASPTFLAISVLTLIILSPAWAHAVAPVQKNMTNIACRPMVKIRKVALMQCLGGIKDMSDDGCST